MASDGSSSKKRKRQTDGEGDETISLTLSNPRPSAAGPILASFPSVKPSKSTPFHVYATDPKDHENPFHERATLLAGQTDLVEFVSANNQPQNTPGTRYMVGLYDKTTNKVTLRPAPVHILTRGVKRLKRFDPLISSDAARIEARNVLGETFGTKKAKAQLKAMERNKVDVSAMQSVAVHLQERIEASTAALPTQAEAKENADSNRLIPPYNADAQDPSEAYYLYDIVPETELKSISLSPFISAQTDQERLSLLPFVRSDWIRQHMRLLFAVPKVNKTNLMIVVYISAMMAFRQSTTRDADKSRLAERFPGIPSVVLDGLVSRFAESARGTEHTKVTSSKETLLLTHMFALCLRIDDYATDTTLMAKDLSLPVTKVNGLFKSLGCKVESLDLKDLQRLGLPSTANGTKRAVLKTPLQFPRPRSGKRK